MLFVESQFVLLFLPLVFFLHEGLRKVASQVWFLIGASLLFYSAWNPWLLLLLGGSVCANYVVSLQITQGRNRAIFIAGLFLNLIPLFYFKYSGMITSTAGLPFTQGIFGETLGSLLPLGISFFTFQQIAYLADVHTKQVEPPKFERYALFVTFFPQLIAGPIVHHRQFVPQIEADKDRSTLLVVGLTLFVIGFFKKTLIADNLAHFVDPLYALDAHTFASSLKATLGYTFQLYFDFSGYSDMALGLAAMFGFRLPQNFNSPYQSRSITEFWRRWHMTLSNWLRDYVYIPLGGNRAGPARTYLNLMLTMLIGGLWHGAAWTFVLWGALHGALLAAERLCNSAFPKLRIGLLAPVLTFAAVALLWVLFRAESFDVARAIYDGFLVPSALSLDGDTLLLILAAGLCLFPNSNWYAAQAEAWAGRKSLNFDTRRIAARFAIYWAVAYASAITLMVVFYTNPIDRSAYAMVANDDGGGIISNEEGDFRSNLYSRRIFRYDGPKVFVVGSSFSAWTGTFEFEFEGETMQSTSLGIGGNGIINGLRSAHAVLDIPQTHTIIFAANPLNFGDTTVSAAFTDECVRPIETTFSMLEQTRLKECSPTRLKPAEFLGMLAMKPSDSRFEQFQTFAYNISTLYHRVPYERRTLSLADSEAVARSIAKGIGKAAQSEESPKGAENGSDELFHWWDRGVIESLREGSEIDLAFANLKHETDARGIRLVIYETPTAQTADAPHIYPEGFFERYQDEMAALTERHDIQYLDASALLPWKEAAMGDFVHAAPAFRKDLHILLLLELFTDEPALEIAEGWKK